MLNLETYLDYCNTLSYVEQCFPFDDKTLVLKCGGKMFALMDINSFGSVNLKCDPEYAIELRSRYPSILPGFHMNKKHWNTIKINSEVPLKLIYELTNHSYSLVFNSLSKNVLNKLK